MQFFINQGRCRVCGKMFCCSNHQKEHEKTQHKEYAYIIDKLPIVCKKCNRTIYFVYDLHLGCRPNLHQGHMNGSFGHSTITAVKSNRKRALKPTPSTNDTPDKRTAISNEQRKKLVPVYKFRHSVEFQRFITSNENASQLLVIGFNQIIMDSKSILSPQWNISYKMLASSIVKSSTPLNDEEKENSPIVGKNTNNLEKLEKSTYHTPELVQSSVLIISSTKKYTPPGIMTTFSKRNSKSVLKNRKVTFELVQTPEIDNNATVYSTPPTTMQIFEKIHQLDEADLKIPNSPPQCMLVRIVKRMRTVIHRIPRSIYNAWDWSNQKFKKSRPSDERIDSEIRSPLKKRPKYDSDEFLTRRPITSYWVNMSVNSLFRKPLPNYVQRYCNDVENYYE